MSLFGAAIDSDDDEKADSFFNHSARSFEAIVAERERQQQRVKKVSKKSAAKQPTSPNIEEQEPATRTGKRKSDDVQATSRKRKQTPVIDDDDDALSNGRKEQEFQVEEEHGHVDSNAIEQVSLPTVDIAIEKAWRTRPDSRSISVIEVDTINEGRPQNGISAESEEDSDDEFKEIAKRARLEQRLKSQSQVTKAENKTNTSIQSPAQHIEDPAKAEHDPTLEILLTSPIPGTKPLKAFYRLTQTLKNLRVKWCQKQSFPPEFAAQVFLTHRLRPLKDSNTCQSIGLSVNTYGDLVLKGAEDKEGVEKVHLEAMTETEYTAALQEEQSRKVPDVTVAESLKEENEESAATSKIRLVLKHREIAPYKLIVQPTTTIAKIIETYRRTQNVPDYETITLFFDGEPLTGDLEVRQTEIDDADVIDVHTK